MCQLQCIAVPTAALARSAFMQHLFLCAAWTRPLSPLVNFRCQLSWIVASYCGQAPEMNQCASAGPCSGPLTPLTDNCKLASSPRQTDLTACSPHPACQQQASMLRKLHKPASLAAKAPPWRQKGPGNTEPARLGVLPCPSRTCMVSSSSQGSRPPSAACPASFVGHICRQGAAAIGFPAAAVPSSTMPQCCSGCSWATARDFSFWRASGVTAGRSMEPPRAGLPPSAAILRCRCQPDQEPALATPQAVPVARHLSPRDCTAAGGVVGECWSVSAPGSACERPSSFCEPGDGRELAVVALPAHLGHRQGRAPALQLLLQEQQRPPALRLEHLPAVAGRPISARQAGRLQGLQHPRERDALILQEGRGLGLAHRLNGPPGSWARGGA